MELAGFRLCLGPSLYSRDPAVVATLVIPAAKQALLREHEPDVREAAQRLLSALGAPALATSEDSAPLPVVVVAHLSVFMLRQLEAGPGTSRITLDRRGEMAHLAYADLNVHLVMRMVTAALRATLSLYPASVSASPVPGSSTDDAVGLCRDTLNNGRSLLKGRTFREVLRVLRERELPWLPLDRYSSAHNQLQIGYGRYQQVFNGTTTFGSSMAGINISYSKMDSRLFLGDLGFPVTRQQIVTSAQQAAQVSEQLGYPVVLKSNFGAHGDGVYADLRNAGQVREAFNNLMADPRIRERPGNFLFVENFVRGEDYRLTMVNGRLLNALHRKPPQVTGDGEHSVEELVARENRHPRRGDKRSSGTAFVPLQLKAAELSALAKQGLTTASIPEAGCVVILRSTANWSNGGTLRDAGHEIHPDNVTLARRIADALQIDMLGVDVITEDPGRSWQEGGLSVIEVNHAPGIWGIWDEDGKYIDQGARIVDNLAPDVAAGQFPIVAIERNADHPGMAAALGDALRAAGFCPGVIDHRGMTVNGEPWARSESVDSQDPAFALLRNREVDAAVVERASHYFLDMGVGAGGCDLSVLTGLQARPLSTRAWPGGVDARASVRLLMRSARRRAIVLVDDPGLAALAGDCPPERLCVLSTRPEAGRHLGFAAAGALALALETGMDGGRRLAIVQPGDGEPTLHPVPEWAADEPVNFLASVAALICLGIPPEQAVQRKTGCSGSLRRSSSSIRRSRQRDT